MKLTGIEITEEGAAAVTVERQAGVMRVTACGQVRREAISSDTVTDVDDGALLAALLGGLADRGEKGVLVLPPKEMIVRRARLPFRDTKTIDKALPFELEPTLPISLEGLHMVWESRDLGEKGTEILVFLASEEVLENRRLQLKAAGLEPLMLVPAAVAPAMTLARHAGTFLTLHRVLGACVLVVVSQGQVIFVRSLALAPGDEMACLSREVWQTLVALAEREGQWMVPEKIFADGWAHLPDHLDTPMGALPLVRPQILAATGAIFDEAVKEAWVEGPFDGALAVACSALSGWRHPVLWRQGFAPAEFVGKHKGAVLFTGLLAMILLVLVTVQALVGVRQTGRDLAWVETEMATLYLDTFTEESQAPVPNLLLPAMEGRVRVAQEEATYTGENASRVRVMDILDAISTTLPGTLKVTLTRMTLAKGKLTVSGLADDFGAIDTMKGALEKSALFSGVTIASSSKESGGDRFQFKVVIDLSREEAS